MQKGFTLIELIIVVAIIGILAVIGVPQYLGYVSDAEASQAQNNLRSIYLAQQGYYRKNNEYYFTGTLPSDSASIINTNLFAGKEVVINGEFQYYILQSSVDDFTANANEVSGSRSYSINHLNQTTGF